MATAYDLVRTCPLPGATFTDTFGAPRPGGRTHQGIDLFRPCGTPIHATHPGIASKVPNTLGGNAVRVQGAAGHTYYAHLSSYGPMGRVAVGDVIGYVGDTGDTAVCHLHFEAHPNDGPAVDPYNALRAVCAGVPAQALPPETYAPLPRARDLIRGESWALPVRKTADALGAATVAIVRSRRRLEALLSRRR